MFDSLHHTMYELSERISHRILLVISTGTYIKLRSKKIGVTSNLRPGEHLFNSLRKYRASLSPAIFCETKKVFFPGHRFVNTPIFFRVCFSTKLLQHGITQKSRYQFRGRNRFWNVQHRGIECVLDPPRVSIIPNWDRHFLSHLLGFNYVFSKMLSEDLLFVFAHTPSPSSSRSIEQNQETDKVDSTKSAIT
jgi:hypothetical protein